MAAAADGEEGGGRVAVAAAVEVGGEAAARGVPPLTRDQINAQREARRYFYLKFET